MSFWKRLFGAGGGKAGTEAPVGEPLRYKGYTIVATPFLTDGDQYQTCGIVSREVDGTLKEHRFVRADRFASAQQAASAALLKGQRIVDEQGDGIFA